MPFVCFCDGCDFASENDIDAVLEDIINYNKEDELVLRDKFLKNSATVRAKFNVNLWYNHV